MARAIPADTPPAVAPYRSRLHEEWPLEAGKPMAAAADRPVVRRAFSAVDRVAAAVLAGLMVAGFKAVVPRALGSGLRAFELLTGSGPVS